MNTEFIIQKIKVHYGLKSDRQLATFLGISAQAISNSKARNSLNIKNIYKRCPGISMDWLLTGKGNMFLK